MGIVARGPKDAGGTNFSPNTTALNNEVDIDYNTIYSEFNGNIENVNIKGTADIALSKLADHGTVATQTSPAFDGSSAATTAAGDIERLRYGIATVKYGNATDQTAEIPWYARSLNLLSNPRNMLRNGSFEVLGLTSGAQSATAAPQDWTAVGAATFINQLSPAADANGRGFQIEITGVGASNTGLSQTFAADALRPSTTYLVYAMAKATAGDTARIFSTGATTELDAETTSTSMKLLHGYFITTAVPAAVTITIAAKTASDVVTFDHVFVAPMVATSRETDYVSAFQQMETVGTDIATSTDDLPALGGTVGGTTDGAVWTDATVSLERSVICPGHGYQIKVTAILGWRAVTSGAVEHKFRLLESTDAGATWQARDVRGFIPHGFGAANQGCQTTLFYISRTPTPGKRYQYTVYANAEGSTIRPQGVATGSDGHTSSQLLVELIPTGG